MRKATLLMIAMGSAIAPVLLAAPARALLTHTWVASTDLGGSDVNSCDRSAPCQTFGTALAKTFAGGEITCVNSSNFLTASLSIDKSITINCEGAIASNAVAGGYFFGTITVTTAATDTVTLRGLDLDGLGFTNSGIFSLINFTGAGVLHLHKVKINNLRGTNTGVTFNPTGAAKLLVSDSTIADNGSSGTAGGIIIKPAAGVEANVTIDRTRIENNLFGIIADGSLGGTIRGVVRDSVVADNANIGITAGSAGQNVLLLIDNTTVSGSSYGLAAVGAGAGMAVGRSSVVYNTTGLFTATGGVLVSYKNNNVDGNGTDGVFSSAAALK